MAIPEERPSPAEVRALREEMGWTQRQVALVLDVTETTVRRWESGANEMPLGTWKGLLWARQQERRRRAADDAAVIEVPILGQVPAGPLAEAVEHAIGTVEVEGRKPNEQLFALVVEGESLTHKHIVTGDTIVVRKQDTARHGDIVVVRLDDEVTVKQLKVREDRVELHGTRGKVVLERLEELHLVGKVVEVRRRYE